MVFRRV